MRRTTIAVSTVGLLAGCLSAVGFETVASATSSTNGSAVAGASSSTADQLPPPQLRRKGRWLVDGQGRVVIIHGLNLVYKRRPYAPPDAVTGFQVRDANWLARHGFNGARIGTLWSGLTPDAPGKARPGVPP